MRVNAWQCMRVGSVTQTSWRVQQRQHPVLRRTKQPSRLATGVDSQLRGGVRSMFTTRCHSQCSAPAPLNEHTVGWAPQTERGSGRRQPLFSSAMCSVRVSKGDYIGSEGACATDGGGACVRACWKRVVLGGRYNWGSYGNWDKSL